MSRPIIDIKYPQGRKVYRLDEDGDVLEATCDEDGDYSELRFDFIEASTKKELAFKGEITAALFNLYKLLA